MMRPPDVRRRGSSGWTLHTKTVVLITGGILLAGAVILAAGLLSTGGTVRSQVQEKFTLAAAGKLEMVGDTLIQSFTVLRGIAVDRVIMAACEAANAEHTAGYESTLGDVNRSWQQSDDDSQLVRSMIDPAVNPAAAQLQQHISGLPEYMQVLVTDSLGAEVAATQQSDLFYHASSPWWLSMHNEGQGRQFVGIVLPTGLPDVTPYFEVAVPVYHATGAREGMIGSVYARIHLGILSRAIWNLDPSGAAKTMIVDSRSQVIAATDDDQVGAVVDFPGWQRSDTPNRPAGFHEAQMRDGTPVLLGHASMLSPATGQDDDSTALEGLGWTLYVYEPTRSAYAAVRRNATAMCAWGGAVLLVVATASAVLSRSFTQPFQNLVGFVDRLGVTSVAARAATRVRSIASDRARIDRHHEAGALARALNSLLDERDELQDALVAAQDLVISDQAHRQRDVDLASSISELVAVSTDGAMLAQRTVDLICEHYGLYYAGLYRVDDAGRWVVLQAGTGEPGREQLAQSYRVAVGSGLVGQCAATGRVQLERDLSMISGRSDEPYLPYARSEIALPLRSRGAVQGVLVADSYQSDTFDDEMIVAMRAIADHVAAALDSLRLYAEAQVAADRLERAYGELTRQSWLATLGGKVGGGYEAVAAGVHPLEHQYPESWVSYQRDAWAEGRTVVAETVDHACESTLRCAIPIRIREEVVGVLDVSKLTIGGDFSRTELAELESLADQLGQALESARLYETAQQSALEAQLVGGATRRLRETLNVDTVLQTAVQELRALLDLNDVEIRVGLVELPAEEAGA